jgi:hypothetical protein
MTRMCRHCSNYVASRARGLCHLCYHTPEVLALYPSKTAHWQTGAMRDGNKVPPLCPRPTQARPGTRAKKQIMRRRVARGYQPCHPQDARM